MQIDGGYRYPSKLIFCILSLLILLAGVLVWHYQRLPVWRGISLLLTLLGTVLLASAFTPTGLPSPPAGILAKIRWFIKDQGGVPVVFSQHFFYSGIFLLLIGNLSSVVEDPANFFKGDNWISLNNKAIIKIVPFLIGLGVILVLGPAVKVIKRKAENDVQEIPLPTGVNKDLWDKFISNPESPGAWIGNLERVLFYFFLWVEKPEFIGGILVFKIATKWEAWKNITKVPEKLNRINDLEFAVARRMWGAKRYAGLFIGTLGNILAALAGYGVSKLFRT